MKKTSFFILLILLFTCFNVRALNKSELETRILGEFNIGGQIYSLSDGQKVIVKRFFRQTEISDYDAFYINQKIDEVINIVEQEGNINFRNYSDSNKTALKKIVADIYANTSIKGTLSKKVLSVFNNEGNSLLVDGIVKQTGYEESVIAKIVGISYIIVLIGLLLFIHQWRMNRNATKI